jgi:heat shock protein HslJ
VRDLERTFEGTGRVMPSFALARMDTMAHRHSMAFRVEGIELAEKPTPAQNPNREVHLVFQPGARLCGSDGCNRIAGRYQLKGDAVTFCPDGGDTDGLRES